MRVLHLAFEDHRRPGSGGGSLRNREINSRLAALGHEIDVVTANYAGAQPRIEDGVSYRQCGLARGYAPSLLSHQMCLPGVVARADRGSRGRRPDLIIEEFAPLASSLGVGHWTRTPTLGVAQGFFAEEKAAQYHLPTRVLTGIQRWGARSHRDLIAVSDDVAARVQAEAPDTQITVVANGVDTAAADAARAAVTKAEPPYLLCLGRLEIHQKGLDILLDAVAHTREPWRLVLAGDGRDRNRLEAEVRERGLTDRVEFTGRVEGDAKWRLIAGASVLLFPSRYETFGISPLEAMACGTPVIASDLACQRALVPARAGTLVTPEDAGALTRATDALMAAPGRRQEMGAAGPEVATHYSWDAIAAEQFSVYQSVVERSAAWVRV